MIYYSNRQAQNGLLGEKTQGKRKVGKLNVLKTRAFDVFSPVSIIKDWKLLRSGKEILAKVATVLGNYIWLISG